jgi:hypothetical protein
MKKRLVSLVLCLVLVFAVLPVSGMAYSGNRWEKTSVTYCSCVSVQSAQAAVLDAMVRAANFRIEMLVKIAQSTPYDDTAWLLRQVDRTVAPVFAYAAYIGATVVCEYVAYEVDGQILMIDPIRVIKR